MGAGVQGDPGEGPGALACERGWQARSEECLYRPMWEVPVSMTALDYAVVGGPALPQRRELRTPIPGPRSRALAQRRQAVVARAIPVTLPAFIERAGGGVVVDVDGNSLIDMGSGIAVTNVGNASPGVVAGVIEQVQRFTHTAFGVAPYESYVAVCEALAERTPGAHEKRSLLLNSGAEAVENAVKIARVHTGRPAIVVVEHAFHGRTNLAMAMTAKVVPYKHGFGPFAGEVYRVPTSYPYRDGLTGPEAAERAIALIDKQVGADLTAAIVVEPIQGEGGFIVPAPGFLTGLAEYAQRSGIVFVADEIQTGFARTGTWFAIEQESVIPDLVITAKGIAGGLPLSAVTGRADIVDSVPPGGLGGTYSGNPLACAAALAVVEQIDTEDLCGRARSLGEAMLRRLHAMADRHPVIGDVRGRGAMTAIELVADGPARTPDAALTARVAQACHERGVLVLTAGSYGNVLRFLPPLTMPDHLLDEALDVLDEVLGLTSVMGSAG